MVEALLASKFSSGPMKMPWDTPCRELSIEEHNVYSNVFVKSAYERMIRKDTNPDINVVSYAPWVKHIDVHWNSDVKSPEYRDIINRMLDDYGNNPVKEILSAYVKKREIRRDLSVRYDVITEREYGILHSDGKYYNTVVICLNYSEFLLSPKNV